MSSTIGTQVGGANDERRDADGPWVETLISAVSLPSLGLARGGPELVVPPLSSGGS